jgi:hypothetical protein
VVEAQAVFSVGQLLDQDELLQEAVAAARTEKVPRLEVEALSILAFAEVCLCRFRHAESTIDQAETVLAGHPDVARPVILDLAIARRAYIKADFATMSAVLRRVTAAGTDHLDIGQAAGVAFLQARLFVALGEYVLARGVLCDDPAMVRAAVGPFGVIRDRELAMIEIAQGRPRSALQILRHVPRPPGDGGRRDHGCPGPPGARRPGPGRRLGRAMITTPSPFADRPLIVEAALCDAEIAQRRGDEGHAAEALDRALLIADDEIVLPFVQAAGPVEEMLARHSGLAARWPAAARTGPPDRAAGAAPTSVAGRPHPPRGGRAPADDNQHVDRGDRRRAVPLGEHDQDPSGGDLPQAVGQPAPGGGPPRPGTRADLNRTGGFIHFG